MKHLGGRDGADGKYTRMARNSRPAGTAFEYMYLQKRMRAIFLVVLVSELVVVLVMVIVTHH